MKDEYKRTLCLVAGDVGIECSCCHRYNHGNPKDKKKIHRKTRSKMAQGLRKELQELYSE